MGFTRDVWMHRIDIARAAGIAPELDAEHDGRIVADIVAEWSRRHVSPSPRPRPARPAASSAPAPAASAQTVDAVEFARVLSGRAEGPGILRHKLPL